jgi:hypothetical protein
MSISHSSKTCKNRAPVGQTVPNSPRKNPSTSTQTIVLTVPHSIYFDCGSSIAEVARETAKLYHNHVALIVAAPHLIIDNWPYPIHRYTIETIGYQSYKVTSWECTYDDKTSQPNGYNSLSSIEVSTPGVWISEVIDCYAQRHSTGNHPILPNHIMGVIAQS